jgi:excisionase family DNA binding protein
MKTAPTSTPAPQSAPEPERKTVRRIRAAKILDVTPRTIDRMIRAGRLKAVYVGALVMVRADSIEAVQEGRA